MAFNDPRLTENEPHHENVQDVIPPTERGQDAERTALTHGLETEGSRPLTDQERKAADRDAPAAERVYAPASERVPVDPVPGHRDFVEHTDTHTAERQAAGQTPASSEPTFTRVPRPSTTSGDAYTSPSSNRSWEAANWDTDSSKGGRRWFGMGIGGLTLCVGGAVGLWLWMRWQRERNKPLNRLRRQALQAAEEIRERVPSPEEAARPAMGLTTAILSILLLWWQQSQTRARHADQGMRRQADRAARKSGKVGDKVMDAASRKAAGKLVDRASDALADVDWQKRLSRLKDRWTPGRLELEKVSISRR